MRKLEISKSALKNLNSLDAKQYRQVGRAIFALLTNPEPHDSCVLEGATHGERRKDVGEYRIIYSANEDVIDVRVVAKRNDDAVYRQWERAR